jgi:hypothetical protein
MDTTTAVVCLGVIFIIAGLIVFALHRKGDVKAGAQIGIGSFFIEAKDRRK